MNILSEATHLFGEKFQALNLLLLFTLSLIICINIKTRWIRITTALVLAITIVSQQMSLYIVKSFIGYQFYIHFNIRDIIGMIDIYIVQIIAIAFLLLSITLLLSYSRKLFYSLTKKIDHRVLNISVIAFFIISLYVMTLAGGLIHSSIELVSMLNPDEKGFKEALKDSQILGYTSPEDLEVTKGKNIIIISLESFERGYLSEKYAHLTPNLLKLKNEWAYHDMNQNSGSEWTSGSLYTYLTGFPAYFGVDGNEIFQSVYHSNISSVGHILNKAGYDMKYITANANFGGTKQMLNILQVDDVIDQFVVPCMYHDKDLFDQAKLQLDTLANNKAPFAMFISTLDTHFPDGLYDKRMEGVVPSQESGMEFMVSAVDYLIADFIQSIEQKGLLNNTVIYIFPDHLKMGSPDIFDGTGERSLYLLSNAKSEDLQIKPSENLYQIDLPNIILNGAGIRHNAKFLTDYITIDKNEYIKANVEKITSLNTSGLLRDEVVTKAPKI
jgi:lipoteichoic acid synthase